MSGKYEAGNPTMQWLWQSTLTTAEYGLTCGILSLTPTPEKMPLLGLANAPGKTRKRTSPLHPLGSHWQHWPALGKWRFPAFCRIGLLAGRTLVGKGNCYQGGRVALTAYAFTLYNLSRIEAVVYEWNPASARVLEKAGYSCEGRLRKSVIKDGKTIDVFLYATVQE